MLGLRMGILFILFLALMNLLSSTCKVEVENCPLDVTEQAERINAFNCRGGGSYHCLLSRENLYVEDCYPVKQLRAADGCAIWDCRDSRPFIQQLKCTSEIEGCPRHENEYFATNEMYRYTSCLSHTIEELTGGSYADYFANQTTESTIQTTPKVSSISTEASFSTQRKITVTDEPTSTKLTSSLRRKTTKKKSPTFPAAKVPETSSKLRPTSPTKPDGNSSTDSNLILIIGIAVGAGAFIFVVIIIFVAVIYIQHMKNKRYKMQFESGHYIPSIPRTVDSVHEYRDIEVYDDIQEIDELQLAYTPKEKEKRRKTKSEGLSRGIDPLGGDHKELVEVNEEYHDFIDIVECKSDSSNGYVEPNKSSPGLKRICESESEKESSSDQEGAREYIEIVSDDKCEQNTICRFQEAEKKCSSDVEGAAETADVTKDIPLGTEVVTGKTDDMGYDVPISRNMKDNR